MSGNLHVGAADSFAGAYSVQDSSRVSDNPNQSPAEASSHARNETLASGSGDRAPLNAIHSMEAAATASDKNNSAVAGILDNFDLTDQSRQGGSSGQPVDSAGAGYGASGAGQHGDSAGAGYGAPGAGQHGDSAGGGYGAPGAGQQGDSPGAGYIATGGGQHGDSAGGDYSAPDSFASNYSVDAVGSGVGGHGRELPPGSGDGYATHPPGRDGLPPGGSAGADGPGDNVREVPSSGGDGGGDKLRAKVEMPSNKEFENAPISELAQRLDANKAALAAQVQEHLPDMPNISFHGTSEVNAQSIENTRTARGARGGIYIATAASPETDASKYVNDIGLNASWSIGAGDTGKPAERIFVIEPHFSVNRDGNYGTDKSPSPWELPYVGTNNNMAKDIVSFNPSNYDQFVLGSIDSRKYVQQERQELNPPDGNLPARNLIRQAFLNQNLTADALAIVMQRQAEQQEDQGF